MAKDEPKYEKFEIPLPADHGWKCKPGFQIFVAERGMLRLDYPASWVVKPTNNSIKFHDKPHPNDSVVLEVSYLKTPPTDWEGLPIRKVVMDGLNHTGHPVLDDEVTEIVREDLEMAWAEYVYTDAQENRDAIFRSCHARTRNTLAPGPGGKKIAFRPSVHAILSLTYYPETISWLSPVWDEIARSLQLGMPLTDIANRAQH